MRALPGACALAARATRWACAPRAARRWRSARPDLGLSGLEAAVNPDAGKKKEKAPELSPEATGVQMRVRTNQEQIEMNSQRLFASGNIDHDPETTGSKEEMSKVVAFVLSCLMFSGGCTMLFVPLYKMYCTTAPQIGGGVNKHTEGVFDDSSNVPDVASVLNVIFRGSLGAKSSPVLFVPLQNTIDCLVGEPTLAFFNVYNKTNKTLIGLSTYNVAPAEAATYFNKIQCFCFEEQRIKPHELIEMPIFFFVDKEFLQDPSTALVRSLLLNYTLFVL
eukprot:TRINITY_DN21068_c0_g1_i1.p1 TRINITY_DN21068_c0_g1~~TRINITY_DN21068_c0_g1_i1.p1  ORF type:complete len:296 (+),score=129.91 TRINITY_DN21068_c0_g1_i1:58-888(+)